MKLLKITIYLYDMFRLKPSSDTLEFYFQKCNYHRNRSRLLVPGIFFLINRKLKNLSDYYLYYLSSFYTICYAFFYFLRLLYIYIYIYIYIYTRGNSISFQTFLVEAFKIVVDS